MNHVYLINNFWFKIAREWISQSNSSLSRHVFTWNEYSSSRYRIYKNEEYILLVGKIKTEASSVSNLTLASAEDPDPV